MSDQYAKLRELAKRNSAALSGTKRPVISHTIRQKKGSSLDIEKYTRSQAIKAMCRECMGWETHPDSCTSTMCPLFPFRPQLHD